jgi:hypothetical protein
VKPRGPSRDVWDARERPKISPAVGDLLSVESLLHLSSIVVVSQGLQDELRSECLSAACACSSRNSLMPRGTIHTQRGSMIANMMRLKV